MHVTITINSKKEFSIIVAYYSNNVIANICMQMEGTCSLKLIIKMNCSFND